MGAASACYFISELGDVSVNTHPQKLSGLED